MVTKWGLSTKLGPLAYADDNSEVFLGKSVTQTKSVSDETAHTIDEEVRKIIEANYATAKSIIVGNLAKLQDRKSVVSGKSVSVRVDRGGGRLLKKKNIWSQDNTVAYNI